MRYISTRGNGEPVDPADAINLGIAPGGGLFVPETVPVLDFDKTDCASYGETAFQILSPLLGDYTPDELRACIDLAYNPATFDCDGIIGMVPLGTRRHVMELWHGPTAAFKDMALQIMPHLLRAAKRKVGEHGHTVILVATSGDTGKAALEGFRDCDGLSIIVFYPYGGVSAVQKLQMVTTEGANTHVVAVKGNFDDCQTGVKELFADGALEKNLAGNGFVFSSANSINWGRLCPQIVYYFRAYLTLIGRGVVRRGDPVNFCVPTGNFGNILAGYYARAMGLPVAKLICASNRNRILNDFFSTGVYDRNREFFKTMSPSMDILISSNLERFLFEITGHDAARVNAWYDGLASQGRFAVDDETRFAMNEIIIPGWVDESRVLGTIKKTYDENGYVLDTHTAVAVAVSDQAGDNGCPTIIDSTANPYKFSGDVLNGISGEREHDELYSIERLHALTGMPVHRALQGLREKAVRHDRVIEIDGMKQVMLDILGV